MSIKNKLSKWVSEMAHRGKVLNANVNNLSLISRTHKVEGEKTLRKIVF